MRGRGRTAERQAEKAHVVKCGACAAYQCGGCQGHRVPCDCTCGEASDGGRLG